eukprot:UN20373
MFSSSLNMPPSYGFVNSYRVFSFLLQNNSDLINL